MPNVPVLVPLRQKLLFLRFPFWIRFHNTAIENILYGIFYRYHTMIAASYGSLTNHKTTGKNKHRPKIFYSETRVWGVPSKAYMDKSGSRAADPGVLKIALFIQPIRSWLKTNAWQVVGRKVVDVRICSCPKRDLQQEEAKIAAQEENARRIAQK
jgi:hypothetical protein